MINTEKISENFIKNFNVPLSFTTLKIFEDQVKSIGLEDQYNEFKKFVDKFQTFEKYLDYTSEVKNNAIEFVKNQPAFNSLKDKTYNLEILNENITTNFDIKFDVPVQKNLYIEQNIGKRFISIDMKSANFNIFRLLGILDFFDYSAFLSKFDSSDYLWKSKQLRQVIFGNLEPKTTVKIIKKIMKEF